MLTKCLQGVFDDDDKIGIGAVDGHTAVAHHRQCDLGERPRIVGVAGHGRSAQQQLAGLRVADAVEDLAEFGGQREDEVRSRFLDHRDLKGPAIVRRRLSQPQ